MSSAFESQFATDIAAAVSAGRSSAETVVRAALARADAVQRDRTVHQRRRAHAQRLHGVGTQMLVEPTAPARLHDIAELQDGLLAA